MSQTIDNDDERATLTEGEMESEVEAQVEAVSATTVGPTADAISMQLFAREQELLAEMTDIARMTSGMKSSPASSNSTNNATKKSCCS